MGKVKGSKRHEREADYDWSSGRALRKSNSSRKRADPERQKSRQKKKQNIDDRKTSHSSICTEREVDAYENPTVIFQCINYGDWRGAAERVASHPSEAATWIVRHRQADGPRRGRQPPIKSPSLTAAAAAASPDGYEIKWKYLPLHLVCLQRNPPICLVKQLLRAFPEAARMRDHDGNLPIHHVCNLVGSKYPDIIKLLVEAYPKGCQKKNAKRRTPADILRRKAKDGSFTSKDVRKVVAILEGDEKKGDKKKKESRDDDNSDSKGSIGTDESKESWYMSDEEALAKANNLSTSFDRFQLSTSSSSASLNEDRGPQFSEEKLQQKIRHLESRLDGVTAERDMLRDDVSKMIQQGKAESIDKEKYIAELTNDIASLEERADDADDLRNQVIDLLERVDIISEENASLWGKNDLAVSELHELHDQLAQQRHEYEQRLNEERDTNITEVQKSCVQALIDELRIELEEVKAERDTLAELLTVEKENSEKERNEFNAICKHLEEQLDACRQSEDNLKQELQKTIEERNELHASIEAVKREAKLDASNAKAAFNERQKALRDEIQSIWSCVKEISLSSPTKKGELMERIMELGEKDGPDNNADSSPSEHVDEHEEKDIAAVPSQQSTFLATEDTISAISEHAWSEQHDMVDIEANETRAGAGVDAGVDANDNNEVNTDVIDEDWLAEIANEVKLLEEESKALRNQLEEDGSLEADGTKEE